MPRTRVPLSRTLRYTVAERDDWCCRKCGESERIDVHHIIPYCNNGEDTLNNLVQLCVLCHDEWERGAIPASLGFMEWLDLPPQRYLVRLFSGAGTALWTAAGDRNGLDVRTYIVGEFHTLRTDRRSQATRRPAPAIKPDYGGYTAVLEVLGDESLTTWEIAAKFPGRTTKAIADIMTIMFTSSRVVRHGTNRAGDPYRYARATTTQ